MINIILKLPLCKMTNASKSCWSTKESAEVKIFLNNFVSSANIKNEDAVITRFAGFIQTSKNRGPI